jgi:HNH endonuclease
MSDAAAWWSEAEFAVVRQELVRPTFRRSTLMRANVRFLEQKSYAKLRGIPFPTATFHDWWAIWQHRAWQDRAKIIKWRERRRSAKPDLTQALVRELLDYNPETGALTHRERDRRWFVDEPHWVMWNKRFAGKPAAGSPTNRYLSVRLFDVNYLAHRVIFLYMTGRLPDPEVDHENHDGTDNRWFNLFEVVTHQQNGRNRSLGKNNTSGRIGVCRTPSDKFFAQIGVDGRQLHLGIRDTFEEACALREAAEKRYGFHKNHGAAA